MYKEQIISLILGINGHACQTTLFNNKTSPMYLNVRISASDRGASYCLSFLVRVPFTALGDSKVPFSLTVPLLAIGMPTVLLKNISIELSKNV